MKLKILKLSLVFLLFALIGASCQDEEELPPLEDKQLTVSEIKSQGCKDNLKSNDVERYIELKAEGENQLRIKFINATLNCAGLDTTYAMINDGILRVTFIDYNWANCICDFDLECVIDSMEQRKYTAKVSAGGEVATFTFHYSKNLDSTIEISPN
ncbi:hypothetical protein [Draconibacterium orientale]|jgi:hypothetical protein|uniref:hypothetical protein n=1 Tax=Draconibacterium orientale TaxID=1168034 RepID=UPI0029C0D137|nr:hypothetical protein [Draconibacterium orientale]